MTTAQEHQCAIWPESRATERQSNLIEGFTWLVSPRAGGEYKITRQAERRLRYMENSAEKQRLRARLTTWLVEMRQQGEEWPLVTTDAIEQADIGRDLHPREKADRLLRYLAEMTPDLGIARYLEDQDLIEVMVHCECIDRREIEFLIEFLVEHGWLKPLGLMNFIGGTVTLEGHARIADVQNSIASSGAFVAMWFDPSAVRLYDDGLKPAIEETGYSPYVINRDPSVNKIDDAIIAAIRDSRFMVADFTHGDDGVRGSVYFEAGFAYGIGIPVIHTCRQDQIEGLHFDTRQYNHIGWSEPEDIVEPLKQRILARIGEGPGLR